MIPNDKLLEVVDRRTTMPEAFRKADEVLQQAVSGITDLINLPALINLDFADVRTVMQDKGIAHIGIGQAKGDDKAIEAVKQAVESPLLETTIEGATNIIINVSGDISLMDASDAAGYVQELAGENANIIFGAMYDDTYADECSITVIATGIEDPNEEQGSLLGLHKGLSQPAAGTDFRYRKTERPKSGFSFQRPAAQPAPKAPSIPTQNATLKAPTSKVTPQDIQIPEFLRRS